MRILGENIGCVERKTSPILFITILTTFLLLFLYHNDVWRPIRYWLFLNGLILFAIPLISLVFLDKKRGLPLRFFSGTVIVIMLLLLIKFTPVRQLLTTLNIPVTRQFFLLMKKPQVVYPLSALFSLIAVIILVLGKVDIRSYGITLGKVKFWVPILLVFFLCMIPLIFWASRLPSFQKTYPMLPLAKEGIRGFIIAELSFGLFFIFWEFFFRGYMLFALEKRTGFLVANSFQAMAFAFMHIGKPELEVYSALVGGLIVGWLCWRSKSFLPAFFIHWANQTMMDLFAVIK